MPLFFLLLLKFKRLPVTVFTMNFLSGVKLLNVTTNMSQLMGNELRSSSACNLSLSFISIFTIWFMSPLKLFKCSIIIYLWLYWSFTNCLMSIAWLHGVFFWIKDSNFVQNSYALSKFNAWLNRLLSMYFWIIPIALRFNNFHSFLFLPPIISLFKISLERTL